MPRISNDKHPELREGEIFLCNERWDFYNRLPFKSKRKGFYAYDPGGCLVGTGGFGHPFPIFVREDDRYDGSTPLEYLVEYLEKSLRWPR
jgi:hypothetical protein